MRTVIIDAYDSFVHIIDQYFRSLDAGPVVIRSGAATAGLIESAEPDLLVLGPGPGSPEDSGHVELVHAFAGRVPILGVCLGHQAIGVAYGATVHPAAHLMHGKSSRIHHDGRGVFADQPADFLATRYHSLIVDETGLPDVLEISARAADDQYVMGMRHGELPIESVQFHPESVTTQRGIGIFRSFVHQHVVPSPA